VGREERRSRARELLDAVRLGARPALLPAHEPTGNLDAAAAGHVLDMLDELRSEHGCSLLVVTHNPVVARRADESCELVDGKLRVP